VKEETNENETNSHREGNSNNNDNYTSREYNHLEELNIHNHLANSTANISGTHQQEGQIALLTDYTYAFTVENYPVVLSLLLKSPTKVAIFISTPVFLEATRIFNGFPEVKVSLSTNNTNSITSIPHYYSLPPESFSFINFPSNNSFTLSYELEIYPFTVNSYIGFHSTFIITLIYQRNIIANSSITLPLILP